MLCTGHYKTFFLTLALTLAFKKLTHNNSKGFTTLFIWLDNTGNYGMRYIYKMNLQSLFDILFAATFRHSK